MPLPTPIDNTLDYINTRDIVNRISYLEFLDDPDLSDDDKELWADEIEELPKLRALESQIDLTSGETLIRDSEFEAYAAEWADEVYNVKNLVEGDLSEFFTFDYEKWADDLQSDYTDVTFDGVTYWTR